jgi:hypothetical protein
MDKTTAIIGAAITVALIAAYVIVTVTNHDANAVLAALVGYLGGTTTHSVATAVNK